MKTIIGSLLLTTSLLCGVTACGEDTGIFAEDGHFLTNDCEKALQQTRDHRSECGATAGDIPTVEDCYDGEVKLCEADCYDNLACDFINGISSQEAQDSYQEYVYCFNACHL